MLPLWQRLKEEPAMIGAILSVIVAIAAPRFGMGAEDVGYLMAAIAGLTGVSVRGAVTPTAKLERQAEERLHRRPPTMGSGL